MLKPHARVSVSYFHFDFGSDITTAVQWAKRAYATIDDEKNVTVTITFEEVEDNDESKED